MVQIKIIMFFLTIITIKIIFINIIAIGDRKVLRMKELIDFTDYLRIYSCDMKMTLDEILLRFNFKSPEIKYICDLLPKEVKNKTNYSIKDYSSLIEKKMMTPKDFNNIFAEIISYYGATYSDILEKKLIVTKTEMEKFLSEYEEAHKEKKNLYNKVSILFGCLTAVILI